MKEMKTWTKHMLWVIFALNVLLTSCAGVKNTRLQPLLEKSNCNQQNSYSYTKNEIPGPIHEMDLDTVLTARFSFHSLNVANAVGIIDILTEYVNKQKDFKQHPSIEKQLNLFELSQKINQRINISSLEVSAISSEMDCEEERTSQIATFLKKKEDELESRLTVGAIIVGAAGAIVTAVLVNKGDGDAGDYAGVAGGMIEAGLGILILLNKQKIDFYHKRNALKVIWEGNETAQVFPPSVWYYLNYFDPEKPENNSLRFQIIEKWMSFGQIAGVKSSKKRKLLDIYFGNGGKYTSEQLENRADMYDQLESYINLMKQDLKNLAMEVENFKNN